MTLPDRDSVGSPVMPRAEPGEGRLQLDALHYCDGAIYSGGWYYSSLAVFTGVHDEGQLYISSLCLFWSFQAAQISTWFLGWVSSPVRDVVNSPAYTSPQLASYISYMNTLRNSTSARMAMAWPYGMLVMGML